MNQKQKEASDYIYSVQKGNGKPVVRHETHSILNSIPLLNQMDIVVKKSIIKGQYYIYSK